MPRKKKVPPFVPLPWLSDQEGTSASSPNTHHDVHSPHHQQVQVPHLHNVRENHQPVGVHPGLNEYPQAELHRHEGDLNPASEPAQTDQPCFLPTQLRLPIDAARFSHLPPSSQDPSTSTSTPIPQSSPVSDPSSDPSYSEEEEEEDGFSNLVEELVKEWLLIELTHNVSKHATDSFWKLALKYFPQLNEYIAQGNKILQFQQLRKKLYSSYAPDVSMCVAFQNRETDTVHELEDIVSIPKTRFPPNQYKKLYETAKVKVN